MSTKGKWLTIEQKCEVIAQHRREPATNYTQLALWTKTSFDLTVPPTRQTIRNILNAAADIEAKRLSGNITAKGRPRCVRSQELEDRLEQYVYECQTRGMRLTRRLLNTQAREILDAMDNPPTHNLSVGWLTRFMQRHGLRFQKEREDVAEGESEAAAPDAVNVQQEPVGGLEADAERARVDKLREKATKRLREIEKEARGIRKYLRALDAATVTNAQQTGAVDHAF